jgi:WD40 repeat protein
MLNKKIIFIILTAVPLFCINAQSHISTQSHQTAVTSLVPLDVQTEGNAVFSAGLDGFIIKWTADGLGEHYQVSNLPVKCMAVSPDGSDIAVYETDGGAKNRVSVWDWKTLTRKYSVPFTDSIVSLTYSAKGTTLICGTTSLTGTVFLNARDGSIIKKITEPTGIAGMVYTSDTENSLFMYTPTGSIAYYNLQNGTQKVRFTTEANLSQPVLFNNNLFLAGIRDDTLFIIQATSGQILAQYPAPGSTVVSARNDNVLYYCIPGTGKTCTVYMIKSNSGTILPPIPITSVTLANLKGSVVCATKSGNTLYLGTSDGTIYKIPAQENTAVHEIQPVTENTGDMIMDIAPVDDWLYFLTKTALYRSSYTNSGAEKMGKNPGYTNIVPYKQNAVLWSKDTKKTVQLLDLTSGQLTPLFTPDAAIQTVRISDDILIDLEGNATVNRFNLATRQRDELYQGTGLQDVTLINQSQLYIAKSSATTPPVVLMSVDCTTKETVPLSLKGTIAYALSTDQTGFNQQVYGIVINNTESNNTTELFSWIPETKATQTILKISEEDAAGFTTMVWPILYSNAGKNQVTAYNIQTGSTFQYKRSASMPVKVVRNGDKIAILNRDGSISWYSPDQSETLADWYFTADGKWFEF